MAKLNLATLAIDIEVDRQSMTEAEKALDNIDRSLEDLESSSREAEDAFRRNTETMSSSVEPMNNMTGSMRGFGDETKSTKGYVEEISDVLDNFGVSVSPTVIQAFTGIGGAVTAVGVGLAAAAKHASENVAEITRLSETAGLSTEAYQQWDGVLKSVGFSMEEATGDIAMFQEKMLEATEGTGEASDMFNRLGISVVDAQGNLRDTDSVLTEFYANLGAVTNETERNAIGSAILGTTYEETAKLMGLTNEQLEAMKENVKVISDSDIAVVEEFNGKWAAVTQTLDVWISEVGAAAIPIATEFLDVVEAFSPVLDLVGTTILGVVDVLASLAMGIGGVVKVISGDFRGAADSFNGMFNQMNKTALRFDDYITEYFTTGGEDISKAMDDTSKSVQQSGAEMFNTFNQEAQSGMSDAANAVEEEAGKIRSYVNTASEDIHALRAQSYDQQSASVVGLNPYAGYKGSFANGIDYVPYDGFTAQLHQGEAVVTAADNASRTLGNEEVVSLLTQLLSVVNRLPQELLRNERMVKA